MHTIQDLFLESFSYELQFDMHFYMHSYLHKKIYSCKKWVLQLNNHVWDQSENLDFTPQVHLNSNTCKLSRLMVATHKYGGKYDMEVNSKEG
jgi:hypothetical protein